MSLSPITAFSNDFFTAFANVDFERQREVAEFLIAFRERPGFADRNYRPIPDAQDPCFYLIPVAETGYSVVVFKPAEEEIYALLWIDREKDACEWGKSRRCVIDVTTGKVSIIKIDAVPDSGDSKKDESQKGLFSAFTRKQLLKLGVPQRNLRKVYSICDQQELKDLKPFLPQLTFESLCLLLSGTPFDEVYELYAACIEPNPVTKERVPYRFYFVHSPEFFTVNADERELRGMLGAPLAKWRVFLHPSQRKLVDKEWNGSVRVMGGAGTGKTVVALHRAAYLARKNPNASILLTTFSKTLADDLQRQLNSLCIHGENANIEVRHIDSWVRGFLEREGIEFQPECAERLEDALWDEAMTLIPPRIVREELRDRRFFKEEWKQVVEWHGVTTREEYMQVPRRGRGVRLIRMERLDLWPVFERFRRSMEERGFQSYIEATRTAREILERRGEHPYSFVIVDECQDISEQGIRLLRALVPAGNNDIFLVGDPYQRIYGYPVVFAQWGINIVGRSRKLWLNYRTTEEIRREALTFVPDTLGEEDRLDGRNVSVTFGPRVEKRAFRTSVAAIEAMADEIEDLQALNQQLHLSEICIVARTQRVFDDVLNRIFINRNIHCYNLAGVQDVAIEGVRLATMHRAKGLEFYHVFILEDRNDVAMLDRNNERLLKENLLRYVAATRAKMSLHIFTY